MISVHGLIVIFLIFSVTSLRPLQKTSETSESLDLALRSLVNIIQRAHKDGRRLNSDSLARAREMYKKITKNMPKSQIKKWLRMETEVQDMAVPQSQAALVEKELGSALTQKKSALLDRPYVERLGQTDFLVMNPEVSDPFVTVVPNAIYYNIEKKCVNWLDDCSLKGIRARLLRGVKSP